MATPPEVPYFFLSHARADVDEFFERFYKDFRNELRGKLGQTTVDGLAFRDTEAISPGALWKPRIERSLLDCRTFLAMLSPTYLTRPECAREWAGFEWRRASYGQPPELLLPVMWIPIPDGEMPPTIQQRQYKHQALGRDYATHGLRYLVKRRGAQYRNFLEALAADVCAVVSQPASPSASLPVPGQLEDPFCGRDTAARGDPGRTPARNGPGHVEFIMVAGSEPEIRAVRQTVAAYGAGIDDWYPYLPARQDRATLLVQGIALQEKFSTGRTSIPPDIVAHVERARESNTMVVLVVDAWSLLLSDYVRAMQKFDAARLINAGVLVLWNHADGETPGNAQSLSSALHAAFRNLGAQGDPLAFHARLDTPEALEEKLRVTLHELRRRVTAFGTPTRMAEGTVTIPQPRLNGPGAA